MGWVSGGAAYVGGLNNRSTLQGYMELNQQVGWSDAPRAILVSGGHAFWFNAAEIAAHDNRIVVRPALTIGSLDQTDSIVISRTRISFPFGLPLELIAEGGQVTTKYGGGDGTNALFITAGDTALTFGRSVAQPHSLFVPKLFASNGTDPTGARQIGFITGTADLNGQAVARGDVFFARDATASGTDKWRVTTSGIVGSTAVLKTAGTISA
jgi:hypothetical protein